MKRRPEGAVSDFFADMIKKSGAKRRMLGIEKAFADNRRIIRAFLAAIRPSMASVSERLMRKPKVPLVARPTSPSGWHRLAEAIINEPSTPIRRQVRP